MAIKIKAPDGSVVQFPDGMPDAQIEAVMAREYPQPTMIDRVAASPIGRLIHDNILAPAEDIFSPGPLFKTAIEGAKVVASDMAGLPKYTPDMRPPLQNAYQNSLQANRNTPGYAPARQSADAMMTQRGSGLSDQLMASVMPSLAGVTGIFGGFDAMNANADAQAAAQERFAAQNPKLSFVANVVGGGMVAPLPRLLPRYADDSPLLSRLSGAPSVGPFPLNPYSKSGNPAQAYVQRVMEAAGKTAEDLAAFDFGGKPVTSAEVIGKPGEVALGALARRDGATGPALEGAMTERNYSAPQRIFGDYAEASGIHPEAARGNIEAFIVANQKAADPLYTEAYKQNTNISSPILDRILETPAGKKALADARVKMQNDMSLMGTPDAELMDQAREGGTLISGNRGVASGMKLRVYDYVKRSLGDQVDAAFKGGNKDDGNIIKGLKNDLVRALDDADVTAKAGPNSTKPEGGLYKQARAKAGEYLGAKKQFELGQDHILDNKLSAQDFAAHVAKLGEAEKQAYAGGVANKLFSLQQTNKLKATIFKSPLIEGKLSALMGREKAKIFVKNMDSEQNMAEFARKRAPGAGSPSFEYLEAARLQDASGIADLAMRAGQNVLDHGMTRGLMRTATDYARKPIDAYRTRGMPVPVRDEAGRMLMLPPTELAGILQTAPKINPGIFSKPSIPTGLLGPRR